MGLGQVFPGARGPQDRGCPAEAHQGAPLTLWLIPTSGQLGETLVTLSWTPEIALPGDGAMLPLASSSSSVSLLSSVPRAIESLS